MMMPKLWRVVVLAAMSGCAVESAGDDPETSSAAQAGMSMQGMSMQGMSMQGMSMQGMSMQGFSFGSLQLTGVGLTNARVEKGELVAERAGQTLRGTALVDAQLIATVEAEGNPAQTQTVAYRIAAIQSEVAGYDPTHTGNTYLYTLEQYIPETATWSPACPVDTDGRAVAIPVAAIYNQHGDRVESTTQFTFGCTSGVIAKCYRWGYRPWVTGYGNLVDMHSACTRMARADYCGDGTSHTHNGTWINMWDTLSPSIQKHGLLPPLGMIFEAGWTKDGAVCLSRARWLLDDLLPLANSCPDRLIPLGLGPAVCDSVLEALLHNSTTKLYNEAYLNLL